MLILLGSFRLKINASSVNIGAFHTGILQTFLPTHNIFQGSRVCFLLLRITINANSLAPFTENIFY
jgi:hypothetical protein